MSSSDRRNKEVKKPVLLSIYIGTQSTRTALVDPSGNIIAISAVPAKTQSPHISWVE